MGKSVEIRTFTSVLSVSMHKYVDGDDGIFER